MGYRSYGAMVIEGPNDEMTALLATFKLMGVPHAKDVLGEGENIDATTETRGDITRWQLKFEDWKWYESFPDIQCFEQFWDLAQENEKLNGFRWRKGEDDEDLEVHEFGNSIEGTYTHKELRILYGNKDECIECEEGVNFAALMFADTPIMDEEDARGTVIEEAFVKVREAFKGLPVTIEESHDGDGVLDHLLIHCGGKGTDLQTVTNVMAIYETLSEEYLYRSSMEHGSAVIKGDDLTLTGTTYFDIRDVFELQALLSAGYTEWTTETQGA